LTVAAFSPGQRSLERADGGGDVAPLDLGHALVQLGQGLAAPQDRLAAPGLEVDRLGLEQAQADLEVALPLVERRQRGCRFGRCRFGHA